MNRIGPTSPAITICHVSYGEKVMMLQRPPRIFGIPMRTMWARDQSPWDRKREEWKTTRGWSSCGAETGWFVFALGLLWLHVDPAQSNQARLVWAGAHWWRSLSKTRLTTEARLSHQLLAGCSEDRDADAIGIGCKEVIACCALGCPKILIHWSDRTI